MPEIRNALAVAVLVCVVLPVVAEVATELLPVVLTLFICAVIFTAATHRSRRRR